YLTTSLTFPSGQAPFAYCDYPGLARGAVSTCSGPVNLPSIQPGTYYLIVIADSLNHVVQLDRSQTARSADSGPVTVTAATSAYPSVTLQFTNSLVYAVNVSANGSVLGTVNASSTNTFNIISPPTLQVSFELVRPSPFGVPLGDPMAGYGNTIMNPVGTYSFV